MDCYIGSVDFIVFKLVLFIVFVYIEFNYGIVYVIDFIQRIYKIQCLFFFQEIFDYKRNYKRNLKIMFLYKLDVCFFYIKKVGFQFIFELIELFE